MKNAVLYLNILFCATFMLACEQDVEVFHASGEDRLNFYYEENAEADSLIDYTFIYLPSEQMLDTPDCLEIIVGTPERIASSGEIPKGSDTEGIT